MSTPRSGTHCGYCRGECPVIKAQAAESCPFANVAQDEPEDPACTHGPESRCFDCATDEELAAAIPPYRGARS